MNAGSASFTAYPDHAPIAWRLATYDDGDIGLYGEVKGAGSLGFLADPADVLRELDAARQVVIDHLVATVGIPADPTTGLLRDVLREVGADLPSPLAHRIRSTIAGDQPETTGRTTVAALAERQQEHGDLICPGCGKVVGGWAGPADPDDPFDYEVGLCASCSAGAAALAERQAENPALHGVPADLRSAYADSVIEHFGGTDDFVPYVPVGGGS